MALLAASAIQEHKDYIESVLLFIFQSLIFFRIDIFMILFRCRATKSPYFSFTAEENFYISTSNPQFPEEISHIKR